MIMFVLFMCVTIGVFALPWYVLSSRTAVSPQLAKDRAWIKEYLIWREQKMKEIAAWKPFVWDAPDREEIIEYAEDEELLDNDLEG